MILAIDPGPERSGWCVADLWCMPWRVRGAGVEDNLVLADWVHEADERWPDLGYIAMEGMEPWRNATAGKAMLATAIWVGRFYEAATRGPWARGNVVLAAPIPRSTVLREVCGCRTAQQAEVRRDIMAIFYHHHEVEGQPHRVPEHPLHGVTGHAWSALAVAIAYRQGARGA